MKHSYIGIENRVRICLGVEVLYNSKILGRCDILVRVFLVCKIDKEEVINKQEKNSKVDIDISGI